MNKWRVTCRLGADENHGEEKRVFATRKKFATRDEAEKYAATVAVGRKAQVGYCEIDTMRTPKGTWMAFAGVGDDRHGIVVGGHKEEIDAVWDYTHEAGLCTVMMYGVPCGGEPMSVEDEAGSGYKRCNRCGML